MCPVFTGLEKMVYRLIVLFLSTEIFSKRRKIYAWMKRNQSAGQHVWAQYIAISEMEWMGLKNHGDCLFIMLMQNFSFMNTLYHFWIDESLILIKIICWNWCTFFLYIYYMNYVMHLHKWCDACNIATRWRIFSVFE